MCVIYVLRLSCFGVCSLLPCGHLLGKGWPLGSCLWCIIVILSLSHVVFWGRFGIWLYWFLNFASFLLHAALCYFCGVCCFPSTKAVELWTNYWVYLKIYTLIYIHGVKSKAPPIFLLKQKFKTTVKKLYWTWKFFICCETLQLLRVMYRRGVCLLGGEYLTLVSTYVQYLIR